MKSFDATPSRTLILRAERGERLPSALEELAAKEGVVAGWVSGLGAVEWAEVAEYDQESRSYGPAQRIKGGAEILHISGNVSIKDGAPMAHLHVTLSQERGERIRVVGGHLVDARLFAAELKLECYDDVSLVRAPDAPTGLALWSLEDEDAVEEPEEEAPPIDAGAGGWAAVAAASQELSKPAPKPRRGGDPLTPSIGDWVRHPKFGLCKIERRTGDDSVSIKLPSARRKTIKLSFLQVGEPRMEGERYVFPLTPRKKS
ncbi:MAG: DUF296 domain-containing protein [Deltaproteobacteria bacterium]|nr:DUF296 domain-containing protein [Deltaproteobacteria bacterium]